MTKKDREKYLNDAEARIKNYVKKWANSSKNRKEITDGIIDVNSYLKSKLKICWVLKEPYDENDGKIGGFSLQDVVMDRLNEKDREYLKFGKTWTPIGYISYSLLNGFLSYSKLQELVKLDKNTVMRSLLEISVFNVGKMPSLTGPKSYDNVIKKLYKEWAPILNYQLLVYDPDVIIFGNTFHHFKDDLKSYKYRLHETKNCKYYLMNNKMIIDTWHPAKPSKTMRQEDYCNGIINSVRKWKAKGKKS